MKGTISICLAMMSVAFLRGQGQAPRSQLKSPEVSADRRITFRLFAPNAQHVTVPNLVTLPFGTPLTLTKDSQGVWSGTTAPMEPDFYVYRIVVDGLEITDPMNPRVIGQRIDRSPFSEVHVPGSQPLTWEPNNVPHGNIVHHFYHSDSIGDDRDFYVYTPPLYDPAANTTYPVLYLLHGASPVADSWFTDLRANVILDNLIAQKKARPMIVVAPLTYGSPIDRVFSEGIRNGVAKLTNSILNEVIPIVERTYRVMGDGTARAIAGYSSGGSQSLYMGLNHLDKFAYIAGFSSALVALPGPDSGRPPVPPTGNLAPLGSDWFPSLFPSLEAKASSRIRLLWVTCGTEDRLIDHNRQFRNWLQAKGIQVRFIETAGGHTPMVWRRNLIDLAQALFRDKK
jgi:enterochelin esterase-like enzyme